MAFEPLLLSVQTEHDVVYGDGDNLTVTVPLSRCTNTDRICGVEAELARYGYDGHNDLREFAFSIVVDCDDGTDLPFATQDRLRLSFDLLMGRVDDHHFFRKVLIEHGVTESELAFFLEHPLVPDYHRGQSLPDQRAVLDERVELYAEELRGGNGQHAYADVEAVRVEALGGQSGPEARLKEVWERYRRPMAVTEAHHGCSRDEQLRWFMEVWRAAAKLKAGGAEIRAVTAWSLLGAVDWNSLLVWRDGHYEPGAFDVRCMPPRQTAIGTAVKALARRGRADHPSLDALAGGNAPARSTQSEAPRSRSGRQVVRS